MCKIVSVHKIIQQYIPVYKQKSELVSRYVKKKKNNKQQKLKNSVTNIYVLNNIDVNSACNVYRFPIISL